MAKLTLTDLSSEAPGWSSTTNANNAATEAAVENTLSRDGTGPNTMSANIDVNGYRVLNHPKGVDPTDLATMENITDGVQTTDTILSTNSVGPFIYPRTSAEIAVPISEASIDAVSGWRYRPGDPRRYGGTMDGATDDSAAIAICESLGFILVSTDAHAFVDVNKNISATGGSDTPVIFEGNGKWTCPTTRTHTFGKIYGSMGPTTVVETGTVVYNEMAFAAGPNATANDPRCIVIGDTAIANGPDGIAIGTNANAGTSTDQIAIGNAASATGIETVAIGKTAGADATSEGSVVIGTGADATASLYSVVIGRQADQSSGSSSVVIGNVATSSSSNNVVIGFGADTTQPDTVVIGRGADCIGTQSVAIGTLSDVDSTGSTAVGYNSQCTSGGDVALGASVSASASGVVALGASEDAASTTRVGPAANNFKFGLASSAMADADIDNNTCTFWIDEAGNQLEIKLKYSTGTVKTGTVALV